MSILKSSIISVFVTCILNSFYTSNSFIIKLYLCLNDLKVLKCDWRSACPLDCSSLGFTAKPIVLFKGHTPAVAPRHTVFVADDFIACSWLASSCWAGHWLLCTTINQRLSKPCRRVWAFGLGFCWWLQVACLVAGVGDGPVSSI